MASEWGDDVRERLDEHGNVLHRHGERLNEHDRQLLKVKYTLEGDPSIQYDGLLDRVGKNEKVITAILRTHRDVRIGAYVIAIITSIIALGVWQPQLKSILTMLGGP